MIYGIPGQGHRPDDHDPDVADYMDTVLAYNEPNQKQQSDISPEDAAFHYSELTQKYRDKVSNVISVIFDVSKIEIIFKEFQRSAAEYLFYFRFLLVRAVQELTRIGWMLLWKHVIS